MSGEMMGRVEKIWRRAIFKIFRPKKDPIQVGSPADAWEIRRADAGKADRQTPGRQTGRRRGGIRADAGEADGQTQWNQGNQTSRRRGVKGIRPADAGSHGKQTGRRRGIRGLRPADAG